MKQPLYLIVWKKVCLYLSLLNNSLYFNIYSDGDILATLNFSEKLPRSMLLQSYGKALLGLVIPY